MTTKERNKNLENRYRELWDEGYRPAVIFGILAKEFKLSTHTLYKILDVKELKY